ncbi:TPA: hypothetical protein ACPE08_005017 [Escherichia coli]
MNTLSFLLFSEEESLFITLGKICVAFSLGGMALLQIVGGDKLIIPFC